MAETQNGQCLEDEKDDKITSNCNEKNADPPKEIVTINIDNVEGGKTDSCQTKARESNGNGVACDNKGKLELPKGVMGAPRSGHRMSFMEEESAKERMRMALLKQCSAILKQGDQRYNKESLHRTFQDEVRISILTFTHTG
ncbi:unnamed protein product, partial [Iphiclides podalirius]